MNLKPSTKYHVRVQLTRPGDGGKGHLGPEAIMETDCPGKSQSTRIPKSECCYIKVTMGSLRVLYNTNDPCSVSPEPTARPEIDSSSVEGRNATIRWSVIGRSRDATGFLVQLFGPHGEKLWEETTLLNVLSTKLYNLEYRRDYQVVVQLVNCGSHGPPSRPHRIHIYKQGKINLEFETQNETLLMFKRIGGGYSQNVVDSLHIVFFPGPSSPRNVHADPLSVNAIRLRWQPPEDPNGGIVKYSIEYQPVGQSTLHPWVDTDDGNKTTMDVTSLNGSTLYQFRVRAFSKVPGEWSMFVKARTQENGKLNKKYHILVFGEGISLNVILRNVFYYTFISYNFKVYASNSHVV